MARTGATRNAGGILVGISLIKRPLGRPRMRWLGNSKADLRETGYEDVTGSESCSGGLCC